MKESKEIKVTLFDLPVQTLLTQKILAAKMNEEAADRMRTLTLIHAKSILEKNSSLSYEKIRKIHIVRIKNNKNNLNKREYL